ncbi:DUF2797 domain-containing protein [Marinilabilia sp.]|uniref:DUF2797 domain-containing protein n=1 Tax=Marinilabilia sp. TaxID=2021252 RepID=UPI0025BAFA1C|nr:DUF2797 domain-containing protein [Marinilabilia sp.]
MSSKLDGKIVSYALTLGENEIDMTQLLDKTIKLTYQNKINCIKCGKETKKSFGQGFCYSCFITAPEADECVLRPERCKAHLGISRDMKWAEEHCLKPHIVYLAVSGGLKVGVTRLSQVPTRWIDQGAERAVRICEVPNRHIAGVIEKYLMNHFGDKTNWKKMVTNESLPEIDLLSEKQKTIGLLPNELKKYALSEDEKVFEFSYPVNEWPQNPGQHDFDKKVEINGKLTGIRGQYLFLDREKVLNVRRFSGYKIQLSSD